MAFQIMVLALRLGERLWTRDSSGSYSWLWMTLGNDLPIDCNSGSFRQSEIYTHFQFRELVLCRILLFKSG